jgi:hypothetical protein
MLSINLVREIEKYFFEYCLPEDSYSNFLLLPLRLIKLGIANCAFMVLIVAAWVIIMPLHFLEWLRNNNESPG